MGFIFLLNGGILDSPPDVVLFFGRFHPVVVHLPIGFLIMAIMAQLATYWPKFRPLGIYLPLMWLMGAFSAFLAVIFGYFLSLSGGYDEDTLLWHQWGGLP
ncbi:DUF2231 domain-containing protein [Arenibacter sp. ARW7G5Y1]|uniref:DUF2231 domain-containing protein n=1 Tax=Arenibacter sp. ARW7G5Y1 TaxID=2135619 RepID=UPI000D75C5BF|nr:DUF2231 domain-containing protein [Arenibacter sp. ARW7G5Y1]PXX31298.1 hypothetical protein C7972_101133 [Arenibacter sp. ARW7G5Y1]